MTGHVRLGLRANAHQFALLVALNALVGGMVGLERSVLPLVGKEDFGLSSTSAILAFVVAFGAAKAFTNLAAGGLVDRFGRKRLLVIGWLVALPVPLLIGDVGRPDLHVTGDARGQARLLHASLKRLLELPDHVVLYPSHYAGSVCGRGLSGNPVSSIGFERAHNALLAVTDSDAFADAFVAEMPPPPAEQERIVAANRAGWVGAPA